MPVERAAALVVSLYLSGARRRADLPRNTQPRKPAPMRKLAHWCVQHRVIVIAIWIAALVAVSVASGSAGTAYRDTFKLSGTQSFDAQRLLQESAPKAAGDSERVVFAVDEGTVRDAAAKQRITATLDRPGAVPGRRRGAVALRHRRRGAGLQGRAHRLRRRAAREGVDQLRAAGVQADHRRRPQRRRRRPADRGVRAGRPPGEPAEPQQHRDRRRRRAHRAAASSSARSSPRRPRCSSPASRSASRSASPACSRTSSRSRRSRRSCRC